MQEGALAATPDIAHTSQFQADEKVQKGIENTVPLSDVKVADYKAVFFVGACACGCEQVCALALGARRFAPVPRWR